MYGKTNEPFYCIGNVKEDEKHFSLLEGVYKFVVAHFIRQRPFGKYYTEHIDGVELFREGKYRIDNYFHMDAYNVTPVLKIAISL